jgi:stalled ribosome rescue protein Dom34
MKATKLGIWMDHERAYLTEFTSEPMKTITIESMSGNGSEEESNFRGENRLHTKEQHQQAEYFKKLTQEIQKYREVVLFGPTDAKRELFNTLRSNHAFEGITIKVEQADKMTKNQLQAFVRKHFTPPSLPRSG